MLHEAMEAAKYSPHALDALRHQASELRKLTNATLDCIMLMDGEGQA
jgi:hypothetical protein